MTAAGPKFSAATRDRDKINASLLGTLYAAVTPRLERCVCESNARVLSEAESCWSPLCLEN